MGRGHEGVRTRGDGTRGPRSSSMPGLQKGKCLALWPLFSGLLTLAVKVGVNAFLYTARPMATLGPLIWYDPDGRLHRVQNSKSALRSFAVASHASERFEAGSLARGQDLMVCAGVSNRCVHASWFSTTGLVPCHIGTRFDSGEWIQSSETTLN